MTTDKLPPDCEGLRLETRFNREVLQQASISEMVLSDARLVSILSGVMTLKPGYVIVAGKPSGV